MNIEQLFDNRFDCYADQRPNEEDGFTKENLVPAMSKDRFVQVVTYIIERLPQTSQKTESNLPLHPVIKEYTDNEKYD